MNASDVGLSLLLEINNEYKELLIFTAMLVTIGCLVLLFHETPLHRISRKLPESCVLITVGIGTAALTRALGIFETFGDYITAKNFFNYLIPPIILDSAFQLYSHHLLLHFHTTSVRQV